jgi:two-component system chemotaxis response regulator CheB
MTAASHQDAAAILAAHAVDAVVIGGSAGSIEALLRLLPHVPADLDVPLLAVLHVPPGRASLLTATFGGRCAVPVREAIDKQTIEPGTLLLAPPDCHMMVERDFSISLSVDAPVHHSRPSIDVLFESAAWAWSRRLLGVLLSGASADGADGLAAIAERGGLAWVQDPDSAPSAFMPRAGLSATAAARPFSIASMGGAMAVLPTAARRHP